MPSLSIALRSAALSSALVSLCVAASGELQTLDLAAVRAEAARLQRVLPAPGEDLKDPRVAVAPDGRVCNLPPTQYKLPPALVFAQGGSPAAYLRFVGSGGESLGSGYRAYYAELTPQADPPGTYYTNGFGHGYFGLQRGSDGGSTFLFSIYNPRPGTVPVAGERGEVVWSDPVLVKTRQHAEGDSGPASSVRDVPWKPGQKLRFLLTSHVDGNWTHLSAWLHIARSANDEPRWTKLATYKSWSFTPGMKDFYVFNEDFRRTWTSSEALRQVDVENVWVYHSARRWVAVGNAKFTAGTKVCQPDIPVDVRPTSDGRGLGLITGGKNNPPAATARGALLSLPIGDQAPPDILSIVEADVARDTDARAMTAAEFAAVQSAPPDSRK